MHDHSVGRWSSRWPTKIFSFNLLVPLLKFSFYYSIVTIDSKLKPSLFTIEFNYLAIQLSLRRNEYSVVQCGIINAPKTKVIVATTTKYFSSLLLHQYFVFGFLLKWNRMQLRKHEFQCKNNKFVDRFTCSQFPVSLFFSVKYWHSLGVSVARYIPADSRSWMIRSKWMLFVSENGYVEMHMPTRLRVQSNLRPGPSNATTNNLWVATSSIWEFIDDLNARDRIKVTLPLQNAHKGLNWKTLISDFI